MTLNEILIEALKNKASDIHLQIGSPPCQRVDGDLKAMNEFQRLTSADLKEFLSIIPPRQRAEFDAYGDADYAYSIPNVSRFRVNSYLQRGTPGFVFRAIPQLNFNIEGVGLPSVVKTIAMFQRGLVLVTGVTGSGKSTTMAAILDYINENSNVSIITLEDPIEFLHSGKKAMVGQREIGGDTASFAQGLRRALRQDPDVIFIGEMRDQETVETALHAAETGHLVLSTLHTLDAQETINRIISIFPPHQQHQIRLQLASVLQAVISQRLLPKIGHGRIPAVEILISTAAVKECIINSERSYEIEDYIKQGTKVYGMQTFDQSIYKLVTGGKVTLEEALKWVKRKDDFTLLVKGISDTSEWS